MRRALACMPLALLFIANVVPTKAQNEPTTTAAPVPAPAPVVDDADITYFDLGRPNNLLLNCTVDNPDKLPYVWSANGTNVEQVEGLRGRYKLEQGGAQFRLEARAHEDDFGNYSCALAGGAGAQAWLVHARPLAKLPANTNVVEGQKLKLVCKVLGKPAPAVQWRYSNDSDAAPGAGGDAAAALGARATLGASDAGVPGAVLLLDAAQRGDAGLYSCAPLAAGAWNSTGAVAATVLRVKDMYAALWPFLGICAEVLVLCVVILVYEKRRAKPELDDSDTDNHDQKKS